MVDTTLLYLQTLLENNWQESYDGPAGTRIKDVPKPEIVMATSKDRKRVDPRNRDVCFVREGGSLDMEPAGLNWTERKRTGLATLDFRTTESRERLEGTRDDNNEKEAYGGLRGEATRIIDEVRKGDKEFDRVTPYEWNPLSEEMAFANWRGELEVRLYTIAEVIEP